MDPQEQVADACLGEGARNQADALLCRVRQQVRAEASKITWPSRRETMISTAMVLVMVIFAALFFFAADQLIGWLLSLVLNVGR